MQTVVEPELALVGDPDDHEPWPSSSCLASAPLAPLPSSAFILASSSSTWLELESSWSWRSMSSWPGAERGDVVERPRRLELGDGVGPRAHLLGLVDRALHGQADVGHLLADPGGRLGDAHLRLGRGVLRLDDLLLGAEGLDLRAQLLLGLGQLGLLLLELGDLLVERLQLGLGHVLALERDAREVLVAGRKRLTGLRVELDDGLLELLGLHLQALLRGDDVRDALLDVLQRFQLLLIAVVERLARVFRPVEQPRDLGLDDGGHASAHTGHADSSIAGRVQVFV